MRQARTSPWRSILLIVGSVSLFLLFFLNQMANAATATDPAARPVEAIPPPEVAAPNASPIVDGVVDAAYGSPLAGDPVDPPQGFNNLDMGDLFVTHDATHFYFAFTVNDNISATTWGKYIMYIDTGNDGAGATSDAWGRNVTVDDPHKPEFSINSWVDAAPYGTEDIQFWGWNGAGWDGLGAIADAALSSGVTSTIEWQVARADLGDPASIWVEVWSTGGGSGDNAQDTVNDPADDWNATDWSTTAVLANSTRYDAPPTVDGVIDAVYGPPLASDSLGDGNGSANMDLGDLYVSDDADNYYVAFTVNDNISTTNWGKYILYIDTTNDGAGATSDAWGRNVTVADPHKPEFSINSWLDAPPYGIEDIQFWSWNGSGWDGIGTIAGAALSPGITSTIEWQVAKADLGNPDAIWVEVWDTGGGGSDNAQDTINEPPDDWNATDWSTTAVLANSTAYPPGAGGGDGPPPIDLSLVRPPVSHTVQNEVFYFIMPDRYQNGDPGNDTGGIAGGPLDHGYLVTDTGYYHGGDLSGLVHTDTLDYIEGLGVSAIWLTPVFENDPVQGDGAIDGSTAGYHGYWAIDYESADPHLGTDQELVDFIAAAHDRGIKVYFDMVANHTGDIIGYAEGQYSYRDKANYPYRDADGNVFDDRDYVLSDTFPALSPTVSFPYTPQTDPGDVNVKNPAWLNELIYYHNRGDSTFAGESSFYGDFFGLDDLFTEHPDVVDGFTHIFTNTISAYDVDGFRLDTVKHVNVEFWQQVIPAVMEYAADNGKPDFFIFGEVFDYDAGDRSYYSTVGQAPAILDFNLQGSARGFAINGDPTDNLRDSFAADDYFTDADSNAYQSPNFISSHDIGRFGGFIRDHLGGSPTAEWLDRTELGHALMFFARGFPIIYYGDEQGFVSDGGDQAAREDMFPSQVPSYNDNDLIGTAATTADDNFDPTHPIYQTLATYAVVYSDHVALRQGAQIHRYSEASAGIYAFSRIDRAEKVEYVVALNNSNTADTAAFNVFSPDTSFTAVYPVTGTATITSDGSSQLTVTVPALDFVIYRADSALAALHGDGPAAVTAAPVPSFYAPAAGEELFGRVEVGVTVTDANRFLEVNFAVQVGGGDYEYIGADNNAPYRIFYDVSEITAGVPITFQAIVNDLNGNYANAVRTAVAGGDVVEQEDEYVIIHYHRPAGDYGDFGSDDFNDFWGLHLWGNALHPDEYNPAWDQPRKFSGVDEYGAYVALRLVDETQPVNFIVHKGNEKDPGDADRSFDPSLMREVWLVQGTYEIFTNPAQALSQTLVHYHRDDADYTDWGLHLWQDGSPPFTNWPTRHLPTAFDDFGAVFSITTNLYPSLELTRGLNFIVHNGQGSQEPDRTYTPTVNYQVWVNAAETDWYAQEGDAADFATIHYRRCLEDYGDYSSDDFNDFWGMHVWTGAITETEWTAPLQPVAQDEFGLVFEIPLQDDAPQLAYILHRGDAKDVPPDQFLDLDTTGHEIWIVEGGGGDNELSAEVQFTGPAIAYNVAGRVCAGASVGDIDEQRAYWLAEDVIGWDPTAWSGDPITVALYHAPGGGLLLDENGISGGTAYTLTLHPAGEISGAIAAKFPHLRGLAAWQIDAADVTAVPDILKGQIAVAAYDVNGDLIDATGLQIPGVLDDLYTYTGALGIEWNGDTPSLHLWAPTAKSVTLHLFDDAHPATAAITTPMTLDAASGVWSATGTSDWEGKYYLYEVEVYVHSTGQVEHNLVTDPYAISLAMNSARSQIVDLNDPALTPPGWDSLVKPPQPAPEAISVYELHVRDFSVSDPLVDPADQGTYRAFTYTNTHGINHLQALAEAGLSHVHLLPVFDIATINEDKSQWQEPAIDPNAGPASQQQQAAVAAVEDQDAFNWGYDPFHYNTPEGSYSTAPTGTTRILEFRQMVQSLNQMGLRVVMDVVYNHTNAAGQADNSVLDKVVPGYYHRLDERGNVHNSTCCANTASEHNMMEKLMVDSLTMWATAYKIDAFRFDLMGHHMITNMLNIRTTLDDLTVADDGVDGESIYLYGEGWNFGEVANNARGVNATQLNMAGAGIGTFSDRLRDAVRGGGPFDSGEDLKRQGFANGLYYDPNDLGQGDALATLLHYSDWIRAGLAGNLADYAFLTAGDVYTTAANIDYNGQPAGYTADPQEEIVYISKHDNQTLYDINVYAIPTAANTMTDRIRVQNVGLSLVSLSQGVPFFHAGSDMLRSKSLDRDSYNSGDWFNALDFTYQHNNFGVGLPVAEKNQENWPIMTPFLEDPGIQAGYDEIAFMADLFREWLEIRYSSPLFQLETAVDVQERLAFHNTGSAQIPGLIAMSISDDAAGLPDIDPNHELVVVLFNANDEAQTLDVAGLAGTDLVLHPVLADSVDAVVQNATFNSATGTFSVPGRTTAVFVSAPAPQQARLQVVHLAPFAAGDAAVDVYLDGTAVLSDVLYNTASGYLTVTAGVHDAAITLAGTMTTAVTETITLAPDTDYTLVAHGGANGYPLQLTLLVDGVPPVPAGPVAPTAYLRIGHLAPFDAVLAETAVDVMDEVGGATILTDVVYGEISDYLLLDPGQYDLRVDRADDGGELFDLAPFTLNDGDALTAFAAGDGLNQALDVVAVPDVAGTLSSLLQEIYRRWMPLIFTQ